MMSQTTPSYTICSPQYITVRATNNPYYNKFPTFTGYVRWYTTPSGGTPVYSSYVDASRPYSDYYFYATNGYQLYVSYYSYATGCESNRTTYTVSFATAPGVTLNYAKSCGQGTAEVQCSGSSSYGLYKGDSYYGGNYTLVQSNSTGYFMISGFDASQDRYRYAVKNLQYNACPSAMQSVYFDVSDPTPPTISGATSFCQGGQTTLTASGNGNTFRWYDGNDNFLYEGASYSFGSSLSPGSYTYRCRGVSSSGCVANPAAVTITVNPSAVNGSIFASASTICIGQSVTISSSGGIGTPYYWCSNDGVATWNVFAGAYGGQYSFIHTPSVVGTYYYYLYNQSSCGFCWDWGGCANSPYVVVNVVAPPAAPSISGGTTICQGGQTTFTASGGTTYRWYDYNGTLLSTGSQVTVGSSLVPGNYSYSVYAVSAEGCTSSASSVTLTVNPKSVDASISASSSTVCYGQPVTISSSGGTGTPYYWCSTDGGNTWNVFAQSYGGQNSFQFTPTTMGTYRFLVRNQSVCGFCWDWGGCSQYNYVDVTVVAAYAPIVSMISPSYFCSPGNVTLRAQNNPYYNTNTNFTGEVRWYNAATGGTRLYTTYVTQGSYSDYSFSASSGSTVWVSFYSSITGCESPRSSYVVSYTGQANISQTFARACRNMADVQLSSGSSGTYEISSFSTSTGTTQIIASNTSGTFNLNSFNSVDYYSARINPSSGCPSATITLSFTIADITPPVVSGSTTYCEGGQTTLTASGNGSIFKWYTGAGSYLQDGVQYTIPSTLAAGSYAYKVYGVSSTGCTSDPASVNITVNQKPVNGTITASAATICLGQSVTISSSGGVGTPYYWCSTNGGASWDVFAQDKAGQSSFTHVPATAGTYRYYLYNQTSCGFCWQAPGGCVNNPYVEVLVKAPLNVSITLSRSALDPADVTLTASAASGPYQWMLNNVAISGATGRNFQPGCAGSYTVKISSSGQCDGTSAPVAITANDIINVSYVRTWDAHAPESNPDVLVTRPLRDVKVSTAYFDGLGRPVQTVLKQGSQGKDLVSPFVYDSLGREVYRYIPYVSTGSDGSYKTNALAEQNTFMQQQYAGQNENNFYSKTDFESSPLNRVIKSMAPGINWAGAGLGTDNLYLLNTAADAVRIWTVTNVASGFGSYSTADVYPAGSLFKNVTIDEQRKQVVEYKDEEQKIILRKVQESGTPLDDHTGWLCTYYIYDKLNQLRAVVQPKAVQAMASAGNWTLDATKINEFVFRYEYDSIGRMTMKKIPGKGCEYMIYDKRDRLVMMQDSLLRAQDKWLVTVYDNDRNKPVKTGLLANSYLSRTFSQHASAASSSNAYPFVIEPASSLWEVLTEIHYDDYSGIPAGLSSTLNTNDINSNNFVTAAGVTPDYAESIQQSYAVNDLVTWTRTKILGTTQYLASVNIYDEKSRPVQIQLLNQSGGTDISTTQFDFAGKIIRAFTRHQISGTPVQQFTIGIRNSYDDVGRSIKAEHSINSAAYKTMSVLKYDALGQLQKKELGTDASTSLPLESLSYEYNVRGWLLGVNRQYVKDAVNNFFGFDLGYDKDGAIGNYASHWYNGNISGSIWKSAGDGEKRKYDFTYDAVNRLTGADFNQYTAGSFNKTAGVDFSVSNLTYDPNGNIVTMDQKGLKLATSDYIDRLSYTYQSSFNSNKLQAVTDASNDNTSKLGDFKYDAAAKTTTDYLYDANGNLIQDLNKKISSIAYNHLNLPQVISITGKGSITFTYSASGEKQKKVVVDNSIAGKTVTTTTTYIGGFVYESRQTSPANSPNDDYINRLQFISHTEGRVRFVSATTTTCPAQPDRFIYDYFIKDHLGNVRMVLTEQKDDVCYPPATVEDARVNGPTGEKQFYDITDSRRIDKATTAASAIASLENRIYRVHGGIPGEKTGLGITLKVMSGDKVRIKAESFYSLSDGSPGSIFNMALTELLSSFTGSSAVSAAKGVVSPSQVLGIGVNNTTLSGFINRTTAADQPRAFLNWILFDEQLKYVSAGADPVPAGGGYKLHTAFINAPVTVTKNGFLYVFVSNESNLPVYFDNLSVTHSPGPILEETHYYPFGLTMAGISSKCATSIGNKNKFSGKELQSKEFSDGSGLELIDFGSRMYDAQLGRWQLIDPLADKFIQVTPYNYGFNNPLRFVDPNGREVIEVNGGYKFTGNDAMNVFSYLQSRYQKEDDPKIISRKKWGAKEPDLSKGLDDIPVKNLAVYYHSIVIHHTGNRNNSPSPNDIQNEQMSINYADVAYNFMIDKDGNIFEGRSLTKVQAHVKGVHHGLIGIALLADLDSKNSAVTGWRAAVEKVLGSSEVTPAMTDALVNLVVFLNEKYGIRYLGGHKEFHDALNPGMVESGDNRYCPGDQGMKIVEDLRGFFKFKLPANMSEIEKNWYKGDK